MSDAFLAEKQAAAPVRLEMRPEWARADDRYGWRHVAAVFGSLTGLMAAAPWLWLHVSPAMVLVILPLLGASIYKLTIVMHDCSHFSLFADKELNRKVGEACGLLLGSDFETFRKAHWKHHKEYGSGEDPQGRDYLGLQQASRARLLWHLIRPLFGYNLFKLASFQTPDPSSPHKPGSDDKKMPAFAGMTRLALIGGIQLVLALLATGFGRVWWLLPLYPAAAASFALFYSQTRGFCEHIAPPGKSGEDYVRSHRTNWLDRLFFYNLNFNYHVEHHHYPQLPSCHLPTVAGELAALGKTYPQSPSILTTIRERLKQCPT